MNVAAQTTDRVACTDQKGRIEDMQHALYHAAQLMEAFCFDRMDKREAMSAAYFASLALEHIADGQGEDAVAFMQTMCDQIKDGMAVKEVKA